MDTRFPPYQSAQQQQNGTYGNAAGTGVGGSVPGHTNRSVPPGMQMGLGARTSSSGNIASSMGQPHVQAMGRGIANQQMYGGSAQSQGVEEGHQSMVRRRKGLDEGCNLLATSIRVVS